MDGHAGVLSGATHLSCADDVAPPMTTMDQTAQVGSTAASDAPTYQLFIAGAWVGSSSGATFESRNPADRRDLIGRFQQGTAADVAMAIRAAEMAFPAWRATPAPKREIGRASCRERG